MEVFWGTGYARASLDDLEEATGLNRSSLYNAFGGKKAIFAKALERYHDGPCQVVFAPLQQKRGSEAIKGYLGAITSFVESPLGHRGCMMVNTACLGGAIADNKEISDRLDYHFAKQHKLLRKRYIEATDDGDIAIGAKPTEAANLIATFVRGVLASAAAGAEPKATKSSIRGMQRMLGITT